MTSEDPIASPRVNYKLERLHPTEINLESDDEPEVVRIAAIGDAAVGKTCFLTRVVFDMYNSERVKTRSVDYQKMTIRTRHPYYDRVTLLEVTDTIGDADMWSANVSHLKRAAGVFICFDATKPESYEECRRWYSLLRKQNEWAVCMLVALKSDLYDKAQNSDKWMGDYEMEQAADRIGCQAGFCAVSAQNNTGVAEAVLRLADSASSTQDSLDSCGRSTVGNVNISRPADNKKDRPACCGKQ